MRVDARRNILFANVLSAQNTIDLQELEFVEVPKELHSFFDQDWTPSFPKLTVLRFGTLDFDHQSVSKWVGPQKDFFLKIINGAPNLKHVTGYFDPDALEFLPKEKYSLLKEFHLFIKSAKHEKICWDLVEAKPAMSHLIMDRSETLPAYRASFSRILEQLLTTSSETVEKLEMPFTVFPLNQLTFPPLQKLKFLEIVAGATPEQVLMVLQAFDYPMQLPTLTEVQLCADPESNFLEEPLITPPFNSLSALRPSTTVKKLSLEVNLSRMPFTVTSHIFPAVTELEVSLRAWRGHRAVVPYADLWACWPQLESVSVIEGSASLIWNFDVEFLGISAEELESVRKLDDESLEKLQIVPVKPSILSMPRKFSSIFVFVDNEPVFPNSNKLTSSCRLEITQN